MITPADTIRPELANAVDRIANWSHGHPQSLRDRLTKPIHDAYQRGRMEALSELLTTDQVATALGISRQYVHRLARDNGIGWHIGRDYLFRPEDVQMLRNRPDRRRRN